MKIYKAKGNFPENLDHNILRHFYVLPKIYFTTSETNRDY